MNITAAVVELSRPSWRRLLCEVANLARFCCVCSGGELVQKVPPPAMGGGVIVLLHHPFFDPRSVLGRRPRLPLGAWRTRRTSGSDHWCRPSTPSSSGRTDMTVSPREQAQQTCRRLLSKTWLVSVGYDPVKPSGRDSSLSFTATESTNLLDVSDTTRLRTTGARSPAR